MSRGQRPYNEDAFQAGTIEIPSFAKRRPISLTRSTAATSENTSAEGASGDPQVFYFGVFDGHGGTECSQFLREQLHLYIEESATTFELQSSLRGQGLGSSFGEAPGNSFGERLGQAVGPSAVETGQKALNKIHFHDGHGMEAIKPELQSRGEKPTIPDSLKKEIPKSEASVTQSNNIAKAEQLEKNLVLAYKKLVGGYFRRFKPQYFSAAAGGQGNVLQTAAVQNKQTSLSATSTEKSDSVGIEAVLSYAFLKADYDFIAAQVGKEDEDAVLADRAINEADILDQPSRQWKPIGGTKRFKGGSTCSIALISTPTPAPFWHPASPSTLVIAHVGDTRVLLCETATGLAVPLTTNHHPSTPSEADRLRRYAATFVTDSFGEERVSGLANTRAFGDMASKRIGVSAEPEIRRIELEPAQYSFAVLVSDGISGTLSDQEIVDIVKEARTPEQAARDIVSFGVEVATEGDNATALVVRLGGWERRSEGGLGSLGTKEIRDWRKQEAQDPRSRRR